MKTVLLQDSEVVALFIHSVFLFPLLALRNLKTLILSLYMPLAHLLFLSLFSFFLPSFLLSSFLYPSLHPSSPPSPQISRIFFVTGTLKFHNNVNQYGFLFTHCASQSFQSGNACSLFMVFICLSISFTLQTLPIYIHDVLWLVGYLRFMKLFKKMSRCLFFFNLSTLGTQWNFLNLTNDIYQKPKKIQYSFIKYYNITLDTQKEARASTVTTSVQDKLSVLGSAERPE